MKIPFPLGRVQTVVAFLTWKICPQVNDTPFPYLEKLGMWLVILSVLLSKVSLIIFVLGMMILSGAHVA